MQVCIIHVIFVFKRWYFRNLFWVVVAVLQDEFPEVSKKGVSKFMTHCIFDTQIMVYRNLVYFRQNQPQFYPVHDIFLSLFLFKKNSSLRSEQIQLPPDETPICKNPKFKSVQSSPKQFKVVKDLCGQWHIYQSDCGSSFISWEFIFVGKLRELIEIVWGLCSKFLHQSIVYGNMDFTCLPSSLEMVS